MDMTTNIQEAPECMKLAVAGLHLSGQPLNAQLTTLDGKLIETTFTTAEYRMYLIVDERGSKPGLVRLPQGAAGTAIEVEVWELPLQNVGKFISFIPQPLGIGTINLADGKHVKGFICEALAMGDAKDISHYRSWRNFLAGVVNENVS